MEKRIWLGVLAVMALLILAVCAVGNLPENDPDPTTTAQPIHTHTYGDWEQIAPAGCTETGLAERSCSCGEKEQQAIPATGHTDVTDEAVEATCTGSGLTEGKHCSVCDEILVPQTEVASNGHTEGAWITDSEPTCTAEGSKHRVCSVCDTTIRTATIPANGHTEGDWITDSEVTCTEDGSMHQICSVCGDTLDTAVIPATGHIYIDGLCRDCDKKQPSEGLEYAWDEVTGGYLVTGAGTCQDTHLVIPDTYLEEPVSGIADFAFAYCTELESVTLLSGTVGMYAFRSCTGLVAVDLGQDVTRIAAGAFYDCTALQTLTAPEGVTTIGGSAFAGCTALADIALPDSVSSIGGFAFYRTAYYLEESNWDEGVLYIGNCLIRANADLTGAYTLRAGTVCIADGAFQDCMELTDVSLSDSVISIGQFCFSGCQSLTALTLGAQVQTIGDYALSSCTALAQIRYAGSLEQWQAIAKGTDWDSDTGEYQLLFLL